MSAEFKEYMQELIAFLSDHGMNNAADELLDELMLEVSR